MKHYFLQQLVGFGWNIALQLIIVYIVTCFR